MKRQLKKIYRLTKTVTTVCKAAPSVQALAAYLSDLKELKSQQRFAKNEFPFGRLFPCLTERGNQCGSAASQYFHQDLLVARRIFLNNPNVHVDVGSRIDGFVAHVASFRPIIVLDIRPMSCHIPNVEFIQADFMVPLAEDKADFCDSLSSLHALEHFGLGRYGDPLNYDGYLLGLDNAYKLLKKGGTFYCSLPIGPQRIEFNAHRVFSVSFLLKCFEDKYHINQFSFVDDHLILHENVPMNESDVNSNFGCTYGCGIFEMTKL